MGVSTYKYLNLIAREKNEFLKKDLHVRNPLENVDFDQ